MGSDITRKYCEVGITLILIGKLRMKRILSINIL